MELLVKLLKEYSFHEFPARRLTDSIDIPVQSNEFNFSVVDKNVADSLMLCSGKSVELHYKEYNGALPWRGIQRYIVDKIVSVREPSSHTEIPIIPGAESL